MTQEMKERLQKELEWNTYWYHKYRNAGFDKQAEANWNTIKGIQITLDIMGFDTECNPDDCSWTITERG